MPCARLATAGERHRAQVARALLPRQCGQAAACDQVREQCAGGGRVQPRQQQRAETRHGQQRLGRRVLAGRTQDFRRAIQFQPQAARGFGRQHARPAQRRERAPALRFAGIGLLHQRTPSLRGAAAHEVVERRFAHCRE
jgi:hypothetical protein